MRARVFPGCKMAASTVYKHHVLGVTFCTQGTHMPPSGSFVTMYLAELHFRNGYMEIGLLISSFYDLDIRKLCARWVPRLLTIEQKQRREDVLIECLAMFHSNKADFLRRFITMDKTWLHHFTPETKAHSKQWTERGESASMKTKTIPSASNVMASVFWDACGIICIDYL